MPRNLHHLAGEFMLWWIMGLALICLGGPAVVWVLVHGLGGLTDLLDAFVRLARG